MVIHRQEGAGLRRAPGSAHGAAADEVRTRDRVLRMVSEEGPIAVHALVTRLGLTETAVRRHVDTLAGRRLIEPHEGPSRPRRGRPARMWVVSEAGHRSLSSDYDHLAGEALRYLADTAGDEAVADFARRRLAAVEERYAARVAAAGPLPTERAHALVDVLTDDGFAASARPLGDGPSPLTGIQLCQGHCPVKDVATEFPQFCDAETEAFSRLLGVHVQRLATLAHGDHVCTTFVPTGATSQPGQSGQSGQPAAPSHPTSERPHR